MLSNTRTNHQGHQNATVATYMHACTQETQKRKKEEKKNIKANKNLAGSTAPGR